MFPAASVVLDQIYASFVSYTSVKAGARLIVPFSDIDTPRASPFTTSSCFETSQKTGPAAKAEAHRTHSAKTESHVFEITEHLKIIASFLSTLAAERSKS